MYENCELKLEEAMSQLSAIFNTIDASIPKIRKKRQGYGFSCFLSNFSPMGKMKEIGFKGVKEKFGEKFGDPEDIIKQKIKEHYNSQKPSNYEPYNPRPSYDNPSYQQSQAINNLRKQQQYFNNLNNDIIRSKLSKKEN